MRLERAEELAADLHAEIERLDVSLLGFGEARKHLRRARVHLETVEDCILKAQAECPEEALLDDREQDTERKGTPRANHAR